jgi:hypothetical protein
VCGGHLNVVVVVLRGAHLSRQHATPVDVLEVSVREGVAGLSVLRLLLIYA